MSVTFAVLTETRGMLAFDRQSRKRLSKAQRSCSTGACGRCCACRMRRAWAAGKFAARTRPQMPDAWTSVEDRRLGELAGRMPLAELAARLSAECGALRTPAACRIRLKRLGVSGYADCVTLRELEAVFGVSHRTIARHWLATGLLPAGRWAARGPNPGWWIERADVETFVRVHTWAFDWQAMRPGHVWTRLAVSASRADPWLRRADVRAFLDVSEPRLRRLLADGTLPARRRPKGGGFLILMRRSDVARLGRAA